MINRRGYEPTGVGEWKKMQQELRDVLDTIDMGDALYVCMAFEHLIKKCRKCIDEIQRGWPDEGMGV
jgi:hypothetical protein